MEQRAAAAGRGRADVDQPFDLLRWQLYEGGDDHDETAGDDSADAGKEAQKTARSLARSRYEIAVCTPTDSLGVGGRNSGRREGERERERTTLL